MTPCTWTDDVSRALIPALDGADLDCFINDVASGVLELWRHDSCYIVTEKCDDCIRVWLIGGEGFVDAAYAISDMVVERGYSHALFRARHPAALRMYRFMNAELIDPEFHEYRVWPLRKS